MRRWFGGTGASAAKKTPVVDSVALHDDDDDDQKEAGNGGGRTPDWGGFGSLVDDFQTSVDPRKQPPLPALSSSAQPPEQRPPDASASTSLFSKSTASSSSSKQELARQGRYDHDHAPDEYGEDDDDVDGEDESIMSDDSEEEAQQAKLQEQLKQAFASWDDEEGDDPSVATEGNFSFNEAKYVADDDDEEDDDDDDGQTISNNSTVWRQSHAAAFLQDLDSASVVSEVRRATPGTTPAWTVDPAFAGVSWNDDDDTSTVVSSATMNTAPFHPTVDPTPTPTFSSAWAASTASGPRDERVDDFTSKSGLATIQQQHDDDDEEEEEEDDDDDEDDNRNDPEPSEGDDHEVDDPIEEDLQLDATPEVNDLEVAHDDHSEEITTDHSEEIADEYEDESSRQGTDFKDEVKSEWRADDYDDDDNKGSNDREYVPGQQSEEERSSSESGSCNGSTQRNGRQVDSNPEAFAYGDEVESQLVKVSPSFDDDSSSIPQSEKLSEFDHQDFAENEQARAEGAGSRAAKNSQSMLEASEASALNHSSFSAQSESTSNESFSDREGVVQPLHTATNSMSEMNASASRTDDSASEDSAPFATSDTHEEDLLPTLANHSESFMKNASDSDAQSLTCRIHDTSVNCSDATGLSTLREKVTSDVGETHIGFAMHRQGGPYNNDEDTDRDLDQRSSAEQDGGEADSETGHEAGTNPKQSESDLGHPCGDEDFTQVGTRQSDNESYRSEEEGGAIPNDNSAKYSHDDDYSDSRGSHQSDHDREGSYGSERDGSQHSERDYVGGDAQVDDHSDSRSYRSGDKDDHEQKSDEDSYQSDGEYDARPPQNPRGDAHYDDNSVSERGSHRSEHDPGSRHKLDDNSESGGSYRSGGEYDQAPQRESYDDSYRSEEEGDAIPNDNSAKYRHDDDYSDSRGSHQSDRREGSYGSEPDGSQHSERECVGGDAQVDDHSDSRSYRSGDKDDHEQKSNEDSYRSDGEYDARPPQSPGGDAHYDDNSVSNQERDYVADEAQMDDHSDSRSYRSGDKDDHEQKPDEDSYRSDGEYDASPGGDAHYDDNSVSERGSHRSEHDHVEDPHTSKVAGSRHKSDDNSESGGSYRSQDEYDQAPQRESYDDSYRSEEEGYANPNDNSAKYSHDDDYSDSRGSHQSDHDRREGSYGSERDGSQHSERDYVGGDAQVDDHSDSRSYRSGDKDDHEQKSNEDSYRSDGEYDARPPQSPGGDAHYDDNSVSERGSHRWKHDHVEDSYTSKVAGSRHKSDDNSESGGSYRSRDEYDQAPQRESYDDSYRSEEEGFSIPNDNSAKYRHDDDYSDSSGLNKPEPDQQKSLSRSEGRQNGPPSKQNEVDDKLFGNSVVSSGAPEEIISVIGLKASNRSINEADAGKNESNGKDHFSEDNSDDEEIYTPDCEDKHEEDAQVASSVANENMSCSVQSWSGNLPVESKPALSQAFVKSGTKEVVDRSNLYINGGSELEDVKTASDIDKGTDQTHAPVRESTYVSIDQVDRNQSVQRESVPDLNDAANAGSIRPSNNDDLSESEQSEPEEETDSEDDESKPYKLVVKEAPLLRLENVTSQTRSKIPEEKLQKKNNQKSSWGWFGFGKKGGKPENVVQEKQSEAAPISDKPLDPPVGQKPEQQATLTKDAPNKCQQTEPEDEKGGSQEAKRSLGMEVVASTAGSAAIADKTELVKIEAPPTIESPENSTPNDKPKPVEHSSRLDQTEFPQGLAPVKPCNREEPISEDREVPEPIIRTKSTSAQEFRKETSESSAEAALSQAPVASSEISSIMKSELLPQSAPAEETKGQSKDAAKGKKKKKRSKKEELAGHFTKNRKTKVNKHGDDISVGSVGISAKPTAPTSGQSDETARTSKLFGTKFRPWDEELASTKKQNRTSQPELGVFGSIMEEPVDLDGLDASRSTSKHASSHHQNIPGPADGVPVVDDEGSFAGDKDTDRRGEPSEPDSEEARDELADLDHLAKMVDAFSSQNSNGLDFDDMWDTVSCDQSTALEFEQKKREQTREKEKKLLLKEKKKRLKEQQELERQASSRLRLFQKQEQQKAVAEPKAGPSEKPPRPHFSTEFMSAIHRVFDDESVMDFNESFTAKEDAIVEVPVGGLQRMGSEKSLYIGEEEPDGSGLTGSSGDHSEEGSASQDDDDDDGSAEKEGDDDDDDDDEEEDDDADPFDAFGNLKEAAGKGRHKQHKDEGASRARSRRSAKSHTSSKSSSTSYTKKAKADPAQAFEEEMKRAQGAKSLSISSLKQEMFDRRGTSINFVEKEYVNYRRRQTQQQSGATENRKSGQLHQIDFKSSDKGRLGVQSTSFGGFSHNPEQQEDLFGNRGGGAMFDEEEATTTMMDDHKPMIKAARGGGGLAGALSRWDAQEGTSELDDLRTVLESPRNEPGFFGFASGLANNVTQQLPDLHLSSPGGMLVGGLNSSHLPSLPISLPPLPSMGQALSHPGDLGFGATFLSSPGAGDGGAMPLSTIMESSDHDDSDNEMGLLAGDRMETMSAASHSKSGGGSRLVGALAGGMGALNVGALGQKIKSVKLPKAPKLGKVVSLKKFVPKLNKRDSSERQIEDMDLMGDNDSTGLLG